jgi:uncharacterized protein (TIGR00156 family)
MRKILTAVTLILSSQWAMAAFVGPSDSAGVTSAAEAEKASDDTPVQLEGYIVKQLDQEHYEFRDNSGTIKVDIDQKRWPAQQVTPQTKVRLSGKVDRSRWTGFDDVEVKSLEIIQ